MADKTKSRRRQTDKLLAEWFWTDAWTGSRGHSLPMEPRGLYREMLTQAWRREAKLPNDHEEIRRIVGCSEKEWKRCWPKVAQFWIEDPGDRSTLVNVTQVVVYLEAKAAQGDAQARAQAGAHAMHKQRRSKAQAPAQALPSVSVSVSDPLLVKNTEIARSRARDAEPFDGEAFMDAFRSGWKSLYGFECSLIVDAIKTAQLRQQLAAIPADRLGDALRAFFGSSEAYVRNAKHPLGLFLRDPLRFLATPIAAAAVPDDSVARVAALLKEGR